MNWVSIQSTIGRVRLGNIATLTGEEVAWNFSPGKTTRFTLRCPLNLTTGTIMLENDPLVGTICHGKILAECIRMCHNSIEYPVLSIYLKKGQNIDIIIMR